MKQQINYIEHQRSVYFKMSEDTRLTPIHISLYMSLFMIWNECGFDTELSINRNDVMKLAKIGNKNTYTTALKQLNDYGYITYKPSFNPLIGSKVTITNYGKGSGKGSGICGGIGGSIGSGKGGGTLYKQVNKENKETLKETGVFFYIGINLFKVKPSEYLMKNYQVFVETKHKLNFPSLKLETVLAEFDKRTCDSFSDDNHFKNSFTKCGIDLLKQSEPKTPFEVKATYKPFKA